MITYIAGPMSGYPEFNRPAFEAEAKRQTDLGHVVLNPAILPDGLSQAEYMQLCMPMVMIAKRIVMLPGWRKSTGATAEHALAVKLGHEVVYAGDDWIKWDGGECPVDGGSAVQIKMRDGETLSSPEAGYLSWGHEGMYHDIIAYRAVKP